MSLLKDDISTLAAGRVGDSQFAAFPPLKIRKSSADNAPIDAFLTVSADSLSRALKMVPPELTFHSWQMRRTQLASTSSEKVVFLS
jgi:hypothetical protein